MRRARAIVGASALAVAAFLLLAGSASALRSAPLTTQRATNISLMGYYMITPQGEADGMIQNTGDVAAVGFRILAPANKPVASASIGGTPCPQVVGPNAFCDYNLPAKATTPFHVRTSVPLTASDGPFMMDATPDNKTSVGPFSIAYVAQPQPKVCQCVALNVVGLGGVNISDPDLKGRVHVRLTLRWTITCSPGAGNCRGSFTITLPGGVGAELVTPEEPSVDCQGECNPDSPTYVAGKVKLHFTAGKGLYSGARANKSIAIGIAKFCVQDEQSRPVGKERLVVAFGSRGFTDRKRSDLNGNGIKDGKEK